MVDKNDILMNPGEIIFSSESKRVSAVVGSGIALTLFDKKRKCGGMCYYIRPLRNNPKDTSTMFACPSIIGLLNKFIHHGSKIRHIEAQIYGGAENYKVNTHIRGLGYQNIKVAKEILHLKKVRISGTNVGGRFGRKIVFNVITGEIIIANVEHIRESDWYPPLIHSDKNRR